MFKKSDSEGDKTPKQEAKDDAAKTKPAADKIAPTSEERTAPANDDKIS